MNPPKFYYQDSNLSVIFEPTRQGYWLRIGGDPLNYTTHFIDERAFQDVLKSDAQGKLEKLDTLDELIPFSLNENDVSKGDLCSVLNFVKFKLDKELAEFKEANNL